MPVGEIQFWVSLSPAAADSASTPRRMRSELYSQGPAAYIPGTVVPNMDKFCAALDRDPEDLSWMFWTPWGRPDDGLPSGMSTSGATASSASSASVTYLIRSSEARSRSSKEISATSNQSSVIVLGPKRNTSPTTGLTVQAAGTVIVLAPVSVAD